MASEMRTVEDAFTDLVVGVSRTLAIICRQLVERGHLNEELLTADLEQLDQELPVVGVGLYGRAIPSMLLAALKQRPSDWPGPPSSS